MPESKYPFKSSQQDCEWFLCNKQSAALLERFPAALLACCKCTYLWSFCAPPSSNENEICLISLHWYIVPVPVCECVREALVKSLSVSDPRWVMIWSPPGASSFPRSFPSKINELAPTTTTTYIYTYKAGDAYSPPKINGPFNAANAIAAKFGAPAGTMQSDFHVVFANNWICPQFGSDEGGATAQTWVYTHTHTHTHCLGYPVVIHFFSFLSLLNSLVLSSRSVSVPFRSFQDFSEQLSTCFCGLVCERSETHSPRQRHGKSIVT